MKKALHEWLDAWGYADAPDALHLSGTSVPANHPYCSELSSLLDPLGQVRAKAVFDVDGVPTVCFLERDGRALDNDSLVRAVRERAWNQNLVSILLVVDDTSAVAAPVALPDAPVCTLTFEQAHRFGEFSSADIQSGDVFSRYPSWFAVENRVDRVLLASLSVIVSALSREGLPKANAQLLMAQVMFVSYLEHRGIVGDTYRQEHGVGKLHDLVGARNRMAVIKLMDSLKIDFNGDVLEPIGANVVWNQLSDFALSLIDDFLARVDLRDGQRDFWHYDFRFVPVELISGIYESFLSDEKREAGAYYTPRNLAVLAVDQAFSGKTDILNETIYDGACGSGILLTTAFRRMLAYAEEKAGRQLDFEERTGLLKRSIFGSDINKSACRVTAFSLYLSVLENLQPADIAKLTAQGKSKLPTLARNNIFFDEEGDFFSDKNPLVNNKRFTIFLSNPPWVEPKGDVVLSADTWAKDKYALPRRQLSAAFMLRALDAIDTERGRFCFILPVSVLGAATSQAFVKTWLEKCELETVINFGDLRKLLFDNAKQPTLVVVARPRPAKRISRQVPETFEYWVPKADVSFAFGRLTLHGTDHHTIQTQFLRQDNSILTSLFWGTPQDLALMARLEMRGQLIDTLKRDGWHTAKGFHKKDSAVDVNDLKSVAPIKGIRYLNARNFGMNGPLLDETTLENFPDELDFVPGLTEEKLASFQGPRIVFKDGMTPNREVCAAFSSIDFSFNSSTAVITAPQEDADVLRFLSVYLHSDLVRYFLLLNAYQVSFERERVALQDIKGLPFVHPDDHHDSQLARKIVAEIAILVRDLEKTPAFERDHQHQGWMHRTEELLDDYFGITPFERARIQEIVDLVLPSVQPSTLGSLNSVLQQRVDDVQLQSYVTALLSELGKWRDAMGGDGSFEADVVVGSAHCCGALGILRLDVVDSAQTKNLVPPRVADTALAALVQSMRSRQLLPIRLHGNFYLAADVVIHQGNSLYLVKPLVRRLWLRSEAVLDALRIVRDVQGVASE